MTVLFFIGLGLLITAGLVVIGFMTAPQGEETEKGFRRIDDD